MKKISRFRRKLLYHCPRTPISITRGGSNIFIHVFAVNIYACINIRIVHNVRARKFRMNKTNGFLSLSLRPSVHTAVRATQGFSGALFIFFCIFNTFFFFGRSRLYLKRYRSYASCERTCKPCFLAGFRCGNEKKTRWTRFDLIFIYTHYNNLLRNAQHRVKVPRRLAPPDDDDHHEYSAREQWFWPTIYFVYLLTNGIIICYNTLALSWHRYAYFNNICVTFYQVK